MDILHGIQGTESVGHQWNTILNSVLYFLGFTKNVIDHALYTLKETPTKDILRVVCSTDNLIFAYYRIHLLKQLLAGINIYLPVISKEGTQLSYLNLRIIQYPYGISIDQPSHIQETILAKWLTYTSEKVNSFPTPFKADTTFELTLENTLPDKPYELHPIGALHRKIQC